MRKTAIVSCYFQHNYGSMLQAYATQRVLDRMGVDNETIDISGFRGEIRKAKLRYFIKASLTSRILLDKLGMVKNVVRKRLDRSGFAEKTALRDRLFDQFSRKVFRLSEAFPSKAELGRQCAERYGAVLVGSDQLWLPGNIAADYYTLSFVPDSVNSIAYATSFGQSALPADSSRKAAAFLARIRHIGVREASGQKLVEKLSGRRVPVVCDPTLLLTGEEWLDVQPEAPRAEGGYIFCYFLGSNPAHRAFAKRLKEATGCRIIALTHLDEYVATDEDYADETPYDVDPGDFLSLIRHADYVLTDSFHCSVFSMQYGRTFFTFRRFSDKTQRSTNSRLDTLFALAGISGRLLDGTEDAREAMGRAIDYDAVHENLARARAASLDYLTRALRDEGSTDL